MAQKHGVRVCDPTADTRLLYFIQSIPVKLFHQKGISKYLLKQTMNNLLPGELLYDAFPKPQTADLGERLKNEHFLAAMVENCMVNHATSGFFDTWKLKRLFVQLASTQSRGRQHVLGFHLLYMLSLINFYGKFGNRKN